MSDPVTFSATAHTIYDGDGLLLRQGSKVYKARLYGIDAPELSQPYGPEAKRRLFELSRGLLSCRSFARDKYGRLLVQLHNHLGEDIAAKLLEEGLAWPLSSAPKGLYAPYKLKTKDARAAGIGLWRQSDPEPPWHHRKRRKTKP